MSALPSRAASQALPASINAQQPNTDGRRRKLDVDKTPQRPRPRTHSCFAIQCTRAARVRTLIHSNPGAKCEHMFLCARCVFCQRSGFAIFDVPSIIETAWGGRSVHKVFTQRHTMTNATCAQHESSTRTLDHRIVCLTTYQYIPYHIYSILYVVVCLVTVRLCVFAIAPYTKSEQPKRREISRRECCGGPLGNSRIVTE